MNTLAHMWTYNRAQSWTTDIEKDFEVVSRNTTMRYCPQSRHRGVALWQILGFRSCLGDHSWIYSKAIFSVWTHWKQSFVVCQCTSMSLLWKNQLTLNVQLKRCWNFLSQLTFCCAVVVTTVARVDTVYDQARSRLLILFVFFVPGVVGHRWVGTAPTEQRNRAALQYCTVGIDDHCGFLGWNWKKTNTSTGSVHVAGQYLSSVFRFHSDLHCTSISVVDELWFPYLLLTLQ